MAGLNITLYANKQNKQINADDTKIVSGEHNATTITVAFPEEYSEYSKRVDFLNVRNEKGTVPLYTPEDETINYAPNFDKLNFSFMLPSAATTNGEIQIQFIAYKPDESESFVPFEIIRLSVEQSVLYVKKNASNNPDLILMAYEYSNLALGIARESLDRTTDAQQAAIDARNAAQAAESSASQAQQSANTAQTQATNAANSASAALTRATNAETSASQAATSASNANTRATNAETAATNSANSAASANARATSAETAATNAANSASSANTRATNAETAATNAQASASQAQQSASQANTRAADAEESARQAALSAQQAVDQTGTKVKINETTQPEITFTSDPQTQINSIKTIAEGKSIVKVNNTKTDVNFTTDPQTQINTLKTADEQNVKITGDQDVAGKKSFSDRLKIKLAGTEGQDAHLKVLDITDTLGGEYFWKGRMLVGAKNLTFLLGAYAGMAGLGVHGWIDADAGTGAVWKPLYLQPDGNEPIYIGKRGGIGWNATKSVVKVQPANADADAYVDILGMRVQQNANGDISFTIN